MTNPSAGIPSRGESLLFLSLSLPLPLSLRFCPPKRRGEDNDSEGFRRSLCPLFSRKRYGMRVRIPPGNLTLLLRLTSPSIFLPFSRCPFPTRLIDNVNAGERGHGREETSFWMSNVNPSALHKDTTGKSVVCAAFAAPPANAGTRSFRNVFLPGIFTRGVYTRDSLPPPFLLLTSR